MNQTDRLIAGLEILKSYKADLQMHASRGSGKVLEIQEEEFDTISERDKARLLELGWETNGYYVWDF